MKNKRTIIILFILLSVVSVAGVGYLSSINPVRKTEKLLTENKYSKFVEYYNSHKILEEDQLEIEKIFINELEEIVILWDQEELDYEKATKIIDVLYKIENEDLHKAVEEKSNYIRLEHKGKEAFKEATNLVEKADYLGAMKSISAVDIEYSNYETLQMIYDKSKSELMSQLEEPSTIEEYETLIATLNDYIVEVVDEEFIELKEGLEEELSEYRLIYDIIAEATESYEKNDFVNSFFILEQGLIDYPENENLEYALTSFHNGYILSVTEKAIDYAEKEEYDEVKRILNEAIEIYDCKIFQDLLDEARRESEFLYAAKATAVDIGKYVVKSGKKLVMGDYTDEEDTALSLGGNIAASVLNADVAMDVRDLSYDILHWGEGDITVSKVALDAVAILPVIGAIKCVKHADTIADVLKNTGKAVDVASDIEKTIDKIKTTKKTFTLTAISDVKKKALYVIKKGKRRTLTIVTEELSDAKIRELQTVLGWPLSRFKKCKIDKDGIICLTTDISKKADDLGIPVKEKIIEYNGIKIRGSFPEFNSKFDTSLKDLKTKSYANECNENLKQAIKKDKKLRKKFTKEELAEIESGKTPTGYVWHHNEEPGKMQLVKREDHDRTIGGVAHTGGNSIWGPDSIDKSGNEAIIE